MKKIIIREKKMRISQLDIVNSMDEMRLHNTWIWTSLESLLFYENKDRLGSFLK